jgi:hypothetical protein
MTIGRDEALILFEILADFSCQATLPIRDEAERLALFRFHGALESTLVEPFQPEYQRLLGDSRSRLLEQSQA